MKNNRQNEEQLFRPALVVPASKSVRMDRGIVVGRNGRVRSQKGGDADAALVAVKVVEPSRFNFVPLMATASSSLDAGRDRPARPAALADKMTDRDRVIGRLMQRMKNRDAAEKWYRSYHISSFGGKTAAQLVRGGRVNSVLRFLDTIDAGVYA